MSDLSRVLEKYKGEHLPFLNVEESGNTSKMLDLSWVTEQCLPGKRRVGREFQMAEEAKAEPQR